MHGVHTSLEIISEELQIYNLIYCKCTFSSSQICKCTSLQVCKIYQITKLQNVKFYKLKNFKIIICMCSFVNFKFIKL